MLVIIDSLHITIIFEKLVYVMIRPQIFLEYSLLPFFGARKGAHHQNLSFGF